jgi:GxxExxY protein
MMNRGAEEKQRVSQGYFTFKFMTNEDLNRIGGEILDAAITVHKELGPGLLESAYELALFHELKLRRRNVQRQVPVSLKFKGIELGKAYEIDLLVEDEIIIEVKSVLDMHPIYTAQIITYLKLRNSKLGYLINFNVPLLKEGFKRIVHNF